MLYQLALFCVLVFGDGLTRAWPIASRSTETYGLNSTGTFWDGIPASDELNWSSCYESPFECARLTVPLNYSEPLEDSLVVALIRYPSPHQIDPALYKGPILFNPGGPGGSGVDFLLGTGKKYSDLFDGLYDIVSFDPRGIGRSTRVSFFESQVERALWAYSPTAELNHRPDGPANAFAKAAITGKLALARDNGVLQHINTEQTARDMLRITEAYGYEKLRYWGFSYGTVLGATFAAMFPDKVDRMILDGVVDSETYYSVGLPSDDLIDSGKIMQAFFDGCYKAGPDNCAFYAPSADAISAKLTALYDQLKAAPVPVVTETGYQVIDFPTLRQAIFRSLYAPYATFSGLAQSFAGLAAGSGEAFLASQSKQEFQSLCDAPADIAAFELEGVMSVGCNDWPRLPADLQSSLNYYDKMKADYDFGSLWSGLGIACSGWPTTIPKNHFTGPFTVNTSQPLLFIGNTADPVTPLKNAIKMAEGFSGSVALTQDGVGHASFSVASPCLVQYVRAYFFDGSLPAPGTVCPVDTPLFPSQESAKAT